MAGSDNQLERRGLLFVLSSPSGAGKSTLSLASMRAMIRASIVGTTNALVTRSAAASASQASGSKAGSITMRRSE